MIRFSCPGCGAVYSVTDEKAGKTGKCPKCQTPFTIPAAEAPAPPPPPKPPATSNPFADLAGDDRPKKKAPAKADLDDDRPRKKPSRAADDDDDFDDRPKKKPARRDEEDDDFDDRPRKKAPSRAVVDDEDDRPRKKPTRRDEEEDDYDDRPRKKKKGRRDDDYDDGYDDRPRRKTGLPALLLVAAILDIVAATALLTNGSRRLIQVLDLPAALTALLPEIGTYFTLLKVSLFAGVLGGGAAVPAAVGAFMKKKWFIVLSLVAAGLLFLTALIYLVAMVSYSKLGLDLEFILMLFLVPLGAGVVAVLAATNKGVKRVLS